MSTLASEGQGGANHLPSKSESSTTNTQSTLDHGMHESTVEEAGNEKAAKQTGGNLLEAKDRAAKESARGHVSVPSSALENSRADKEELRQAESLCPKVLPGKVSVRPGACEW
ncbi:expressed unknown protein [Seminavis robusta]|uniref:Uncharacterized protein n=1 Tax=Seminavis robusta TaxID=568900 RepID=A0A9N8DV92_9STRA|nr:expressed unknown protein [Seminavis robusta]|eukprot:Sro396_g134300.1 n/a (113) ;mRNA; r:38129-38467